ncbi:hypothetical protein [Desulforamulus aeronauticus]|uniref:Mannosyl-glycoprotein endo-beta-N-acetylglucosaminidase n=1 Tax=Desulforamulus aeronauticus DSM 10349 TaxID=1121421 RepID=A0A1M6NYQ1_9FIRM|nr:hypothetical protein [Desulforamulus aeronauticus]SHK00768.1 hypothetical protein SAMN02745123_00346 [Desulforamulus aeronauticus DSM 10349]
MEFEAKLEQIEILQSNHVTLFRNYIQKKFPTASPEERSIILADAVYKAMNKHIEEFDTKIRDRVKHEVLKRAVMKDNYNIKGTDIFYACLALKDTEEELKESLVIWLNNKCNSSIKKEYLDQLYRRQSTSSDEWIEYDLGRAGTFKNKVLLLQQLLDRIHVTYTYVKQKITARKLAYSRVVASFLITTVFITYLAIGNMDDVFLEQNNSKNAQAEEVTGKQISNSSLPNYLRYREVDKDSLVTYLVRKNSLLSEEKYISAIIQASFELDVNPLLLIAITGQEQAYVPKNHSNAAIIANNPFNVFGSWQVYNTDILDSARIAARTVVELSKNRPQAIDPIVWINHKYAEDKRWHEGVNKNFADINREVKTMVDSL